MTTIDRPSRRKASDKRTPSRGRRRPSAKGPAQAANAGPTAGAAGMEAVAPVERRVYAREPRVWEEWESPLRQRLLARRIVRWVRLRVSRAPESDRS